jgi:hypothetical protein
MFRIERSGTAAAGRSDGLAIMAILNIAARKHA